MDEKKLVHKPHVGPEPVQAKPNADREKAWQPANSPKKLQEEREKTPVRGAEDKVEDEMSEGVDEVKRRL